MEMTKQQLIQALSPELIQQGHSPQDVRNVLETYTVPQLEEFVRKQQNEQNFGLKTEVQRAIKSLEGLLESRKRLAQVQAEREADWIEFQVAQGMAREPGLRAEAERQLLQDEQTFAEAARSLRSFGVNQANLNVCRTTLGPGFTLYDIQNGLSSNAIQLSPPSYEELTQWAAEDIEAHNEALLKADDVTLRARVRQEAAVARAATAQAEADRQLKSSQERDSYAGFPPLPDIWQGRPLDAAFIRTCDPATNRLLIKRFGASQVTARLRSRG
jgi:hypothetical protein